MSGDLHAGSCKKLGHPWVGKNECDIDERRENHNARCFGAAVQHYQYDI